MLPKCIRDRKLDVRNIGVVEGLYFKIRDVVVPPTY